MWRIPVLTLSLAALPALETACDSGSFQGELPGCVCETVGCSPSACSIELTLDETCTGELSEAEVLVGDHVEADLLRPKARVTTCSKVEPGKSADVWVRGGPWIWGPLTETCDEPRKVLSVVLQCIEAKAP